LLTLYLEQIPTTRIFTMLTCRPEFTPPWGPHSYLTQLTLSRLGRPHVEAMVEKVVGEKALPSEVLQQIVAKTDGVPLFVEELTKMVIESGLLTETNDHYELNGPLPPLAIPSTLQDSLMARLDRLASVRELAQLGATIGREFSYDLLHAVSPLDNQMLQDGLQQLVETELVYQRGTPPQSTCRRNESTRSGHVLFSWRRGHGVQLPGQHGHRGCRVGRNDAGRLEGLARLASRRRTGQRHGDQSD